MNSNDLANVAFAIATVAVIFVPLTLAAAGLVFQLTVSQASTIAGTALRITSDATSVIVAFSNDEYGAFWQDGYSEDEFVKFLQVLASVDFHPQRFSARDFDPTFRSGLSAFAAHLHAFSGNRNIEGLELQRGARTREEQQAALAFAVLTERLQRTFLPFHASIEGLGRDIQLYSDIVVTWRDLRDDLRRFGYPIAALVIASLITMIAALTHSPSLVQSEPLNLSVALALTAAMGAGLGRVTWMLRRIVGRF